MGNEIESSIAFALIKTKGKDSDIETALSSLTGISELHFVTGPTPYIAKLSGTDNIEIGRAIGEISSVDGVESIQTLVVLETIGRGQQPAEPSSMMAPDDEHPRYKPFLRELVKKGVLKSPIHRNMKVGNKPFIRASGSVLRGLYNYYYSGKAWGRVELYIDRGTNRENKEIFDLLFQSKDAIEAEFGKPLNWARLDAKRACRISYVIDSGGYGTAREEWDGIQTEMVDAMVRLEAALRPRILELKKQYS